MRVPDYISPIIGYRIWQWDAAGLKSLNGELWFPRQPLSAVCRADAKGSILGLTKPAVHDAADLPSLRCTCGVYAAKSREHLNRCGYRKFAVRGEVFMWGRMVEHERGWRAEFAYPKTFILAPGVLPFSLSTIDARLRDLTAFGTDIFILHHQQCIALWKKGSGYDATGLDCLIANRETYYVRRLHELTIKQGDRVAILGRGIGVVKDTSPKEVTVMSGKSAPIRMLRKEIVRDHQNNRWEWKPALPQEGDYASSNLRQS
jgi:hypothetical protein